MSRLPRVDEDSVSDPQVVQVYTEIRQELGLGIVPNIFTSMAIRPTLLRANWDKFRAVVLQGYLPRTLKEMIGVVISQSNGSEYTIRVHMHSLSLQGVSTEVLTMLTQDFNRCPLPERTKYILRFGLLSGTNPLSITDEDYTALRNQELRDEEIFEIIATADLFASVNAYTDSIALEIDQLG